MIDKIDKLSENGYYAIINLETEEIIPSTFCSILDYQRQEYVLVSKKLFNSLKLNKLKNGDIFRYRNTILEKVHHFNIESTVSARSKNKIVEMFSDQYNKITGVLDSKCSQCQKTCKQYYELICCPNYTEKRVINEDNNIGRKSRNFKCASKGTPRRKKAKRR